MSADLDEALRDAICDPANGMSADLGTYMNEPSAFPYRPVPREATKPICIINPPSSVTDMDGLTARREIHVRTLGFYGVKASPGSPEDQSEKVDDLARRARDYFHRNKWAVQGDGFRIIDIVATGPIPGPTDDDETIARLVTLRLRLGRTQ